MATNMIELMAMLKDQNRASSSFTPPLEHRPTVDPNSDSLTGSALDWFMTLKAGDIPTWTNLSQKFLDQYRFCAETPPTLLDLSMMEMRENFSGICTSHALYIALSNAIGLFPGPANCYSVATATILLARNKIRTEAPGPNFDPIVQNQNLRYEFHQGAPGHTLDTCWRLRDRIQEMISTKQISFNEVKQPNVRVNPFRDHGSSSGSSINMISICYRRGGGSTGSSGSVHHRLCSGRGCSYIRPVCHRGSSKEPYQDRRVPWDCRGEVANMEQEMSAMGITRSGRIY
ncbi:hypothetical protein CRG98_024688 [Punica granatum]|uniref:Retrotransposon gag domain-containing protein n=1 Tax=Punica granatum TaxID=22663 RepID=A0A2I0JH09_PUNGR|nr:hypothetical protein CRG98_024688 [Punica granatum]